MAKLEIYEEKQPEEKTIRLRLLRTGDDIQLAAVDSYGEPVPCGNLLVIGEGGVRRNVSVSSSLGLPLDDHGRVLIVR